jgi:hypothetical protein
VHIGGAPGRISGGPPTNRRKRGERSVGVMVGERVCVVLRARIGAEDQTLPQLETSPSQPLRLVAGTSGRGQRRPEHQWVVELEVDLTGMILDAEYWLRSCHGFLVDSDLGHGVGVVVDVELTPDSNDATALVLTSGWFGREVFKVAVADVQAIVPGERRLLVKHDPQR